jgi:hypothetical protein
MIIRTEHPMNEPMGANMDGDTMKMLDVAADIIEDNLPGRYNKLVSDMRVRAGEIAEAAGFPLFAAKINRPNSARNYEIRVHRTELIPGGNGALLGFSDDHPDRQFLIIPEGEK